MKPVRKRDCNKGIFLYEERKALLSSTLTFTKVYFDNKLTMSYGLHGSEFSESKCWEWNAIPMAEWLREHWPEEKHVSYNCFFWVAPGTWNHE